LLQIGTGLDTDLTGASAAAQISRVFRVFAMVVRTTYLLTALLVLAWAAPALVAFAQSLFHPERFDAWDLYGAVIFGLLCFLPLRALERLLHRSTLVPDSRIRERPVVASLVVVTSMLGWTLALLAGWVGITSLPRDDIGGPLGGALMLALMLFAIALLVGEIVLVGRPTGPTLEV
jgi:hypothetical protein